MTAQEKINKIIETIESGKTVYITSMTRSTKITKATLKRWEKNGHTLLKSSGNSMYVASGSKFVCIDYCKITTSQA